MGRIKKFLYLYFSAILLFVILSALGAKTLGGDLSPIEYFWVHSAGDYSGGS